MPPVYQGEAQENRGTLPNGRSHHFKSHLLSSRKGEGGVEGGASEKVTWKGRRGRSSYRLKWLFCVLMSL